MRPAFYYAVGFGFLGLLGGAVVGELVGVGLVDVMASIALGGSFGTVFGAVLGVAQRLEELYEAVDELRDRLDSRTEKERPLPPRVGATELPRFEEERSLKRPVPIDDLIEPPPQSGP